jgi:diphosphomevalonate decarboxylase
MDPRRFARFFANLRKQTGIRCGFQVDTTNNFPTAAGLASSASGFAALAMACTGAAGKEVPLETLSAVARLGSASAARAVFGGWVILRSGARAAEPLFDCGYWPELRVLVVAVEKGAKPISSRQAMEHVRKTSPYYRGWLRSSEEAVTAALQAIKEKDLTRLGQTMRTSYMRMFASMLAADPPVVYWLPESVRVIHECEQMRQDGLTAWETMDAGPQVKILCRKADLPDVKARIGRLSGVGSILVAKIGPAPVVEKLREAEA